MAAINPGIKAARNGRDSFHQQITRITEGDENAERPAAPKPVANALNT